MILILMGVSGVGKTTIGTLLSARIGWPFEDADDYHPSANREKMAAGFPLTDADRAPWLAILHEHLKHSYEENLNLILACSALKQNYRNILRGSIPDDEINFIYLHAAAGLIHERILARSHQFMNPNLLQSQLTTLEEPSHAWSISVDSNPESVVDNIVTRLRQTHPSAIETEPSA